MQTRKTSKAESKLYDHQTLLERLRMEIKRAERYARTLSLARVGIDKVEVVQRELDLNKKKLVLREVGQIFSKNCRSTDVVGYYGEDGLAIVLPETSITGAFTIAQRVKEKIAKHKFSNFDASITISAGTASYPRNAATVDGLVEQANHALKLAMDSGPNNVRGPRVKG